MAEWVTVQPDETIPSGATVGIATGMPGGFPGINQLGVIVATDPGGARVTTTREWSPASTMATEISRIYPGRGFTISGAKQWGVWLRSAVTPAQWLAPSTALAGPLGAVAAVASGPGGPPIEGAGNVGEAAGTIAREGGRIGSEFAAGVGSGLAEGVGEGLGVGKWAIYIGLGIAGLIVILIGIASLRRAIK